MTDHYRLATMEITFETEGGLGDQPQFRALNGQGWEVHVVKDTARRDDGVLVMTLVMRRPLAHPTDS